MKLVEPTLIVKLGQMIGLFVGVRRITLETLSKDAEENVIAVETVLPNKSVFNSNVWLLVVKEVIVSSNIVILGHHSKPFLFSACGENANCEARNNRAQCSCPPDFLGDPNSRCYTECTRHDECQDNQVRSKYLEIVDI